MAITQRIPSPSVSTAAEHLRHEAAQFRAAALRLEALAETLESEGPFDHPDFHTKARPWREAATP